MSATYRIHDEPTGRPHPLIFNPFWPLLAMMLAGAWLGALLFALNAVFLRGPTARGELALSIGMLAGVPVLLLAITVLRNSGYLPGFALDYALLAVVTWKLALAYWTFFLQQNAYALYEYFGGGDTQRVPLGAVLVMVGMMVRSGVVDAFPSYYWQLTMA